jgi:hypothetical protein
MGRLLNAFELLLPLNIDPEHGLTDDSGVRSRKIQKRGVQSKEIILEDFRGAGLGLTADVESKT